MSLSTQAKVLRVLQEGEFERLGSSQTVKVNVRILAATNKNLEKEVEAGRFRQDLYYRLKIISIHLPPLRERLDDVPALVHYFVARFAHEYSKPLRYVSDPAVTKLRSCAWPGNVRELENCMRRAVLMCKGDVLLPEHVHFENEAGAAQATTAEDDQSPTLKQRIAALVPEILRIAGPNAHANVIDLVEEVLIARAPAGMPPQPGPCRPDARHQPEHAPPPHQEIPPGAARHLGQVANLSYCPRRMCR